MRLNWQGGRPPGLTSVFGHDHRARARGAVVPGVAHGEAVFWGHEGQLVRVTERCLGVRRSTRRRSHDLEVPAVIGAPQQLIPRGRGSPGGAEQVVDLGGCTGHQRRDETGESRLPLSALPPPVAAECHQGCDDEGEH